MTFARRDFLRLGASLLAFPALQACGGAGRGVSIKGPHAGLSSAGLQKLDETLADYTQRRSVPGLVGLLSHGGETHVSVFGAKTLGTNDPVQRDTLFRIASMTKPVTALATLMLVEEGKLKLDEPVERLLPELAARKVLRRIDGPLHDTVPQVRPITVNDLLTFRLGFGFFMSPTEYPIHQAVTELELMTLGGPAPATPLQPDEWLRRFGTLPLMFQPGEKWLYGTGSHLLGVLVARASGKPLERYLSERIFEPLGMRDTGFFVPEAKLARFVTCYAHDEQGALAVLDGVKDSQWRKPPAFPDGAAGLVSTIDDYFSFAQLLLNRGVHQGQRLVRPDLVQQLCTDQLTSEQATGGADILLGRSWGFGVAVTTKTDENGGAPGRYGWDGGFGSTWANDPERDLVGILLTQRVWDSPSPPDYVTDFWRLAYGAISP